MSMFELFDTTYGNEIYDIVPNATGGADIIGEGGDIIAHARMNDLGGVNIYDDEGLEAMTIPNAVGGVDIYDGDMNMEGMTIPDPATSEEYIVDVGNGNDIMTYEDPLFHSSEYQMDAMIFV